MIRPAGNILKIHEDECCMEIRIFVVRKFVKRTKKIMFSLVFVCFPFTGFPSNENVRRHDLSANAYSCVTMKFSYTIAVRKNEIFCRFVTKTDDFSLVFRSTFC